MKFNLALRSMVNLKVFAVLLVFSSFVHGQELRAEAQGIRCSALTFVFTSLASRDPDTAINFYKASNFFRGVFAAGRKVRTKMTITNGEADSHRELVLNELKNSWRSNPDVVIQEAALCQTWGDEFMPKIRAGADINSAEDVLYVVGQPPTVASEEQIANLRNVAPAAFAAWRSLDFATPANLRDKLQDSLKSR